MNCAGNQQVLGAAGGAIKFFCTTRRLIEWDHPRFLPEFFEAFVLAEAHENTPTTQNWDFIVATKPSASHRSEGSVATASGELINFGIAVASVDVTVGLLIKECAARSLPHDRSQSDQNGGFKII